MPPPKILSLSEMTSRVPDGASLALGGSFLHRGPFAFVRELIRQRKRGLEIIKQSPGYDIDILCRAGCVAKARAGIVAVHPGGTREIQKVIMARRIGIGREGREKAGALS